LWRHAGGNLLPGSNGNADYWDLKRNTQVKHDILSSYLLRWASILSGGQGGARRLAFHYVDGFAGRGRYSGGEPGSPLIAMEIGQEMYEHRGGNVRLNCYNVEQDPKNFASLEKEVEEARPRYPSVEVSYFQGPFQEHSDEILRLIPESEDTFVFIDPFGPKGVELNEVMRFLVRRRSEVFITFMSNYIGRFMTDAHKAGRRACRRACARSRGRSSSSTAGPCSRPCPSLPSAGQAPRRSSCGTLRRPWSSR
jgi:three-Cys-motif partner protein